jgi:dipeptidyl aminopeptidase
MHTPLHNPTGYANTSISNTTALANTVRFLIMHGVADDNVHMQNTLTLLDKLDLATVENYDVHVFPDSDHSIYFHNANRIVYDSMFSLSLVDGVGLGSDGNGVLTTTIEMNNWLINAFNGEWLRVDNPVVMPASKKRRRDVESLPLVV